MINILISKPNFDGEWAYKSLAPYLMRRSHVLIIPLSYNEGWASDEEDWDVRYAKGSKHYEKIVQPFRNYLIPDENIEWLNYYENNAGKAKDQIHDADVIFLFGSNPAHMMQRIEDLGIEADLRAFDGVLIGNQAGAQIMLDEFPSSEDWDDSYHRGLGFLRDFDLISEYVEDEAHLSSLIYSIETRGKAVFAYPEKGGLLIHDGHYELLGDAFTCNDSDLDKIYHAYEDAKSRMDYYGDNGDW
jgi:hypothetical protein